MPETGPSAYADIAVVRETLNLDLMNLLIHSVILGATLLGSTVVHAQTPANSETVFCGGETPVSTVERYFADLRNALTRTSPKSRFNVFVDHDFGVRDRQGRTLYFKVKDFDSITPSRITIEEWRQISRRGAKSLHNAGWRGCFMSLGKVWFSGSKEGGFRLTLIARDIPWTEPEKGDVLP